MWRETFSWAARLNKQLYTTLPANPQHTKRLSDTTNLISLEYINAKLHNKRERKNKLFLLNLINYFKTKFLLQSYVNY